MTLRGLAEKNSLLAEANQVIKDKDGQLTKAAEEIKSYKQYLPIIEQICSIKFSEGNK